MAKARKAGRLYGRHRHCFPLEPDRSLFVNQRVPTACGCVQCSSRRPLKEAIGWLRAVLRGLRNGAAKERRAWREQVSQDAPSSLP